MTDLLQHIHIEDRTETSPVIFHAPHGSETIPHRFRADFQLNSAELGLEHYWMVDRYTDRIAQKAATVSGSSLIRSDLSRLVVDVEKFPDEREELFAKGMSAFYTRTADGRQLRPEPFTEIRGYQELRAYYEAYGRAFTELVERALAAHGRSVIIDVHSYPVDKQKYELHWADPRPEIDLGTDGYHTPEWLIQAAREAFGAYECGVNQPFHGTYVPLDYYETDPRVSSIMIEMRRDKVDENPGDIQQALNALGLAAKTYSD
jgi:N-formylglutamate deformylase